MVILGLVLIALGAGAIVSAVFTAEVQGDHVQLLGALDMSPLTVFLVGLGSGLAIWFGFAVFRWGFKRDRARRREQKRLGRLADRVEQVEHRRDADALRDDERDDRRTL